jgi:cytidylate kinase
MGKIPHRSIAAYLNAHLKESQSYSGQNDRRRTRPYITISRQVGAYGTTVASALKKEFTECERRLEVHWQVYDKDLIEQIVQEHDLRSDFVDYFDEEVPSFVEDMVCHMLDIHPEKWVLVNKMKKTIQRLAGEGYAIFIGRGAHLVTRDIPGGIRIRLIDAFDRRVAHVQEYFQLTKNEARHFVIVEEKKREAYIREYFECDINDPSCHDMVINCEHVTVPEIVKLVKELIWHHTAFQTAAHS